MKPASEAAAIAVSGLARTCSTHEPEDLSFAQAADRRECVRARATGLPGQAAQNVRHDKSDREGADQCHQRLALDELAHVFG